MGAAPDLEIVSGQPHQGADQTMPNQGPEPALSKKGASKLPDVLAKSAIAHPEAVLEVAIPNSKIRGSTTDGLLGDHKIRGRDSVAAAVGDGGFADFESLDASKQGIGIGAAEEKILSEVIAKMREKSVL